jgi:hypothetical protein
MEILLQKGEAVEFVGLGTDGQGDHYLMPFALFQHPNLQPDVLIGVGSEPKHGVVGIDVVDHQKLVLF